jgi:hypothetical protein
MIDRLRLYQQQTAAMVPENKKLLLHHGTTQMYAALAKLVLRASQGATYCRLLQPEWSAALWSYEDATTRLEQLGLKVTRIVRACDHVTLSRFCDSDLHPECHQKDGGYLVCGVRIDLPQSRPLPEIPACTRPSLPPPVIVTSPPRKEERTPIPLHPGESLYAGMLSRQRSASSPVS